MGGKEKRIVLLLLTILALDLLYFSGIAVGKLTKVSPTYGGRYREGVIGQPRLINPVVGTTSADQALINLVYSGLYKYDKNGKVVPDLAVAMPEVSEDQKQYTVELRQDAEWHNGKRVTANDVVFTIDKIKNEDYSSPLRALWANTNVEKLEDFKVKFSSKDVFAPFIHNLTLPIMPAEVWSGVSPSNFLLSSLNLKAVGSGPYTIREISNLPTGEVQSIKLESFSNYYGGKPYIDTLTLVFFDNYEDLVSALHAKNIDGFGYVSLDATLTLNTDRNNINLYKLPLPQYQGAFFNLKNPILNDKNVRKALTLATDREKILQEVFSGDGLPLNSPLVPEELGILRETNFTSQDIGQANEILEAAGWKLDPETNQRTKKDQVLELTITSNDFPFNARTAEMLANQWSSAGVKTRLNIVPTSELINNLLPARSFDVLVFAVKLPADPDPFIFWHSSQTKEPGLNITQFSSPEVDKLITEARNNLDLALRQEKYLRIQEIIKDEAPVIPLHQTVYLYSVSKSIKGIGLESLYDPAFRFYDSPKWFIEEKRVLD